jgi:hypothetical protein
MSKDVRKERFLESRNCQASLAQLLETWMKIAAGHAKSNVSQDVASFDVEDHG